MSWEDHLVKTIWMVMGAIGFYLAAVEIYRPAIARRIERTVDRLQKKVAPQSVIDSIFSAVSTEAMKPDLDVGEAFLSDLFRNPKRFYRSLLGLLYAVTLFVLAFGVPYSFGLLNVFPFDSDAEIRILDVFYTIIVVTISFFVCGFTLLLVCLFVIPLIASAIVAPLHFSIAILNRMTGGKAIGAFGLILASRDLVISMAGYFKNLF